MSLLYFLQLMKKPELSTRRYNWLLDLDFLVSPLIAFPRVVAATPEEKMLSKARVDFSCSDEPFFPIDCLVNKKRRTIKLLKPCSLVSRIQSNS